MTDREKQLIAALEAIIARCDQAKDQTEASDICRFEIPFLAREAIRKAKQP